MVLQRPDLRFEGRQVLTRGDALRADQLTLEAEAAVRMRRIEADFQVFEQEKLESVWRRLFFLRCLRLRRAARPSPPQPTPSPRPSPLRSRRRPLMKKGPSSRPSSRN